jgi:hypothetical protein
MRISADTMRLVRATRRPGFQFAMAATQMADGSWLLPVNDDVAMEIATERLNGEADDGVLSRLLQENYRKWRPDRDSTRPWPRVSRHCSSPCPRS